MKRKALLSTLALLLAISLVVVGCAEPAPAPTPAPPSPPPGPPPGPTPEQEIEKNIQELYEAAKAEGELLWQFMGPPETRQPLVDAFQKHYPGIKTTVFSISATEVPTRIITESQAGNLSMDVSSQFPYFALPLVERELLMKCDWTQLGIPDNAVLLDNTFVVESDSAPIWVYNTNLVSEEEAPKTWEDLLDPRWKGSKISIRAAVTPFTSLFSEWKENPEKVVNYLKKLQQQEVVPGKRNSAVVSRIATGECEIGSIPITFYINLTQLAEDKAPLAVAPISPTGGSPSGYVIPKGASHPNAAKLFIAWIYSPEGRQVSYDIGDGMATPCDASIAAKILCDNNIKHFSVNSAEDVELCNGAFGKMVLETMQFMPK